ncbi:MAG: metallophosphoesterase [Desulfovibrio sp.]|nr:metallophosphoesterase [Desulfovibrio sp.]
MCNILVIGDTHGEWGYLASLLLYYQPDICLVTGDFGWWPGLGELPHLALPREVMQHTQIHFLDGNHENHQSLLAAAPRGSFTSQEIAPNIVYHPRGSLMQLPDGRRVFFAGGAKSIDWKQRIRGKTWFPEEILRPSHLPKELPQADIVLSHTIPSAFKVEKYADWGFFDVRYDFSPDKSQETLNQVLQACKPQLWLAGHYHRRIDGHFAATEYHVLDMLYGGLCRPEGLPCTFWLSGGPGIQRQSPGWALPHQAFIPLVENASGLYACADMRELPWDLARLFAKRRTMYRTQKVDGIKGLVPREADSFLNCLCRFHWDPLAALGDRKRDPT